MTPDYNLCDVCGAKCDPKTRMRITYGSSMGPAGSSEPDVHVYDLCAIHLTELIVQSCRDISVAKSMDGYLQRRIAK